MENVSNIELAKKLDDHFKILSRTRTHITLWSTLRTKTSSLFLFPTDTAKVTSVFIRLGNSKSIDIDEIPITLVKNVIHYLQSKGITDF